MRNYRPPLGLELFARIQAEYALRRDPVNAFRPINYEQLLREHQLTIQQWAEVSAFWTPRVNNPRHPAAFRYKALLLEMIRQLQGEAEPKVKAIVR